MGKYFYGILFIVIFALMVFAINTLTEGGNQSARAIFRFSGENSRVREISRAYRESLLGKEKADDESFSLRENPMRKSRIKASEAETIILDDSVDFVLPRDLRLGNALDLQLSRIEITGQAGRQVLVLLANAADIEIDAFSQVYDLVSLVADITQVVGYPVIDPLTVEIYQRRDRIKNAITK
ncbi:MAG: hypothetical protein ACRCVN_02890 [Spirochaetia bacterium]